MARANLKVTEELLSAWAAANESGNVRYISVAVSGESIVVTGTRCDPEGGAPTPDEAAALAWVSMKEETKQRAAAAASAAAPSPAFASPGGSALRGATPLMWILCIDPAAARDSHGRWVIVSWTPEGVHPRAKMLYASARDDVKRALGAARFEADYHVGEESELSASAFALWRDRDRAGAMSNSELAQEQTTREVNRERSAMPVRVATMNKIPFKADEQLKEAFARFVMAEAGGNAASSSSVPSGWIEIAIGGGSSAAATATTPASPGPSADASALGETLTLASSGADGDASTLLDRVAGPTAAPDPRFFLLAPSPPGNGAVVMLYHCPELSRPKSRMIYSTAKAAVAEAATAAGVALAKVVETRDKDDVSTALQECAGLKPGSASGGAGGSAAAGAAGARALTSPTSPASAGSGDVDATPSKAPGSASRFGGVGLPGMSFPSPRGAAGAAAADSPSTSAAAAGEADAESFARPSRPGRGGSRLPPGAMMMPGMGMALPGLASPGSSNGSGGAGGNA